MTPELEESAESIIADIKRAPKAGRGRAYPETLRRRAVDLFERAKVLGTRAPDLAARLGIGTATLYQWRQAVKATSSKVPSDTKLVRPVVVHDRPMLKSPDLVLEFPGGVRVHGLDVVDLAKMIRAYNAGA